MHRALLPVAALLAAAPALAAPNTPALLEYIEWSECAQIDCYVSPGYPIVAWNSQLIGTVVNRGPMPRPTTVSDVCRTQFGAYFPFGTGIEGELVRVFDTGVESGVCIEESVLDPVSTPIELPEEPNWDLLIAKLAAAFDPTPPVSFVPPE